MAGSRIEYDYMLELYNVTGTLLERVEADPDFVPAIECARFQAFKRDLRAIDEGYVVPIWREAGPPYVKGVEAVVPCERDRESTATYSTALFQAQAETASAGLIKSGLLQDGEQFLFVVKATPRPLRPGSSLDLEFVDDELPAYPLRGERDRCEFAGAVTGVRGIGEGEFDVFVPECILSEAEELMTGAGSNETGGFLLGRLWRDRASRSPFMEITGFVPAAYTQATDTRLTFTPESWAALHAAIDLRGDGEMVAGWLHTHPCESWCKCHDSIEKMRECPHNLQFFSNYDCVLHRTVFFGAHQIGILLGQHFREDRWQKVVTAYGWRLGKVESRAICVTR